MNQSTNLASGREWSRDEPLILGVVAFLSILIMIFNLIVDIAYGFLDPRIRYE